MHWRYPGALAWDAGDQSLASNSAVSGRPHDPSMSVWPHRETTNTVRDHLIARNQGHAVVTVRLDVGYMSIRRVDPPRHGDKSQHTGADRWRRLFSATSPHIQVAAAGESMHRTADRLPAARTRSGLVGVQRPMAGPTEALSPAETL